MGAVVVLGTASPALALGGSTDQGVSLGVEVNCVDGNPVGTVSVDATEVTDDGYVQLSAPPGTKVWGTSGLSGSDSYQWRVDVSEYAGTDYEAVTEVVIDGNTYSDGAYGTVPTCDAGGDASATFDVRNLDLPPGVTEGESFTASATVENTGEVQGETDVELVTSKDEPFDYDSQTVSLDPGESTTVEITVWTEPGDAGTYDVALGVADTVASDAVSVTVVQSDEVSPVVQLQDGGRYYVGQQLRISEGIEAGESLDLIGPDGSTTLVFADDDGALTIDTTELSGEGEYRLEDDDFENGEHSFSLLTQEFATFAFGDDSIDEGGTATISLATNRRQYFLDLTATIGGERIPPGTLQSVLGTGETVDTDGDGTPDAVRVQASNEDEFTVSVEGEPELPTGSGLFTVTATVPDTTAEASASVRVGGGGGEGSVTFANNVIQEHRGDAVLIDVTFENAETATLTIGNERLNYLAEVDVTDGNGDGEATVRWNTHRAGHGNAFSAADPADSVSATRLTDGFSSGRRIASESYPMDLSLSGEEVAAGTITLVDPDQVERTLSVNRARSGLSRDDAIASPSETSQVAVGEWLILRVNVAGIDGYIDDASDLAGSGTQGVSLRIEETSVEGNEQPHTVDVSTFDAEVDEFDNHVTLSAQLTEGNGFEIGETYRATLSFDGNPYHDDGTESVSFDTVERAIRIDARGGQVVVQQATAATITGSSTLSEGRELVVQVRDDESGLFASKTVTTDRDGSWAVDFDFSEVPQGQTFSVLVSLGATTKDAPEVVESTGKVGPRASIAVSGQSPGGESVLVDATVPADGDYVAAVRASDGQLVGTSRPLSAGEHEDVRVDLDQPISGGETELEFQVWQNLGDAAQNPGEDPPYALDGEPVTDSATVTLPSPTTTTPPTSTTTTTRTTTTTTTTTTRTTTTAVSTTTVTTTPGDGDGDGDGDGGGGDGGGGPGLGVVTAVVALLAVALLAARRRE